MKITQQTVSIDGIDKIIKHLIKDAPIQILANVQEFRELFIND